MPIWILYFLVVTLTCFAQEDSLEISSRFNYCPNSFLEFPASLDIQIATVDMDFRKQNLQIRWNHYPNASDTFVVNMRGTTDTLYYISSPTIRYMRDSRIGIFRAMAQHHLREQIRYTNIRWDDLELLAKGDFHCQDFEDKKWSRLRTAQSNTWYSIRPGKAKDTYTMFGLRGMIRNVEYREWLSIGENLKIPSLVLMKESNGQIATLTVQSFRKLVTHPVPMRLPKSTYQDVLRSASSRYFLWPPEETRRDAEIVLPPFK